MKRIYIFIFFSFLCLNRLNAQLDTIFWFVAPEVSQTHGDRPIVFRFASLGNPATITITQPANPLFPAQTVNLGANAAQTVDLTTWIDIIENKPANSVLNYGFKITSTTPITAYYEVNPTCNCNPDIFSLKGKNSLGTSFLTPFQNFLTNASYARSAFNIVATENNTSITIIPTQNIVGHVANVPFTIVLNEGQTYCAEATSTAANQHLGGSVIIADKPVAVTLSDDTAQGTPYGGCADLMGDQLIPISVIGEEYIAIKGYLNGPDKLYVVGVTNNTQITIDGVAVGTVNASQTYVHTLSNPTAYIQSSAPVYLLHQSGFGCEVGEAILPPIVCTGSNTVAFVRSTNEFFAVNLLVPTGGEANFLFNGAPGIINPTSFNFVPGTGNTWMYAQIDASGLLGALQAARIENPTHKFHMGLIHGGASSGCRFGYFSDFASLSYSIQANDESFCVGDTINLVANNLPGATYEWTGPSGFSFIGDTVIISNAQVQNSGQYIVSGNLPGACDLLADSLVISVIDTPPSPQIFSNGPVCEGEDVQFWNDVTNPFTFTWTDGMGAFLSNSDTLTFAAPPQGNLGISITSNIGECISNSVQYQTQVYANPIPEYNGPNEICGDQINLEAIVTLDNSDPFASITWYNINNNILSTSNPTNIINSSNAPDVTDSFFVSVLSQHGCIGTDTFTVTFHPYPIADLSWTDLCDGATIDFTSNSSWSGNPNGSDFISENIDYGDGNSGNSADDSHTYMSPGTYNVLLTATSNFNCLDTISQSITVYNVPEATITIDDGCGKVSFDVAVNSGNNSIDSLSWIIENNPMSSYNQFASEFASAGNYNGTLEIFTSNNCQYNFPFNFNVIPTISIEDLLIPNVLTANNDQNNDEWFIDPLFSNCNEFTIRILNRWGIEVFKMDNLSGEGFKGEDANGNELLPGVYFYVLESGQEVKHGTISLIR